MTALSDIALSDIQPQELPGQAPEDKAVWQQRAAELNAFADELAAGPYAKYDAGTQSYLKGEDTVVGTLKHAAIGALNGATFDAADTIYRKFIASEKDKKELDAYNETHIADDVGNVAGMVAGTALTAGVAGEIGLTAKAAQAGEVVGSALGSRLAGNVAAEALNTAAITAPKLVVDSFKEDPAKAAQDWLLTAAVGGMAVGGLRTAGQAVAPVMKEVGNKAYELISEAEAKYSTNLGKLLNNKENAEPLQRMIDGMGGNKVGQDFLEKVGIDILVPEQSANIATLKTFSQQAAAQIPQAEAAGNTALAASLRQDQNTASQFAKIFERVDSLTTKAQGWDSNGVLSDAVKSGISAIAFHMLGFNPVLGAMASAAGLGGKLGGNLLQDGAQAAWKIAAERQLATRFMDASTTAVKTMAESYVGQAIGRGAAVTAVKSGLSALREHGFSEDDSDVSAIYKNAQAGTGANELLGALREGIDTTPAIKQQVSAQLQKTQDYLFRAYPKNPNPPSLLEMDPARPWKPSRQDLQQFADKVGIVNNPLSAIDKLQQGVLNANHIEALNEVWPGVYQQLKDAMVKSLSDPDNQAARDFYRRRRPQQFELFITGQQTQPGYAAQVPLKILKPAPSSNPNTGKSVSRKASIAAGALTPLDTYQRP